jgi:hypothetical protein
MKKWMGLLVCFILTVGATVSPSSAQDTPSIVVGRIFYIEGDLLRYVPAEKDWVATVRDAPFGTEDALFSGSGGMAELVVPNGTWIRIGNSTQIQFIALETDLAEMDIASGMARFYNKGSNTVIKATSPFGYVLADPGTVFDFYVGDNSVEVVALRGKVSFVHSATEAKYDVVAGSPSILADEQQVSLGEGTVDPSWDRWNMVRENFWTAKARRRGRSFEYLPPSLRDESYALDENGRWERVYYEGAVRWFWRPTTVALGWSPFTVGRWTVWYGDQTWIPAEPFGYITHHYGNWVYVRNYWYWAPPVVSVRVGMPFLGIGFFWYPGRVFWIHTGPYVGWVPLAPFETYYCYRPWSGPRVVVVNNVNIAQINVNIRNYSYVNHAIVINQNNFYRVNNYRNVRVTNISRTTIINNYHAAPVVNNTVVKNYTTIKQRYNYTNVRVKEKPHNTVINRIQHNETIIHEGRKEKTSVIQERMKSIPEGKVDREARIQQPKIPNYIVPTSEVNRPKSEIKLQHKEIKTRARSSELEKPATKPEHAVPPKLSEPEKPVTRPERVVSPKPGERQKPVTRPERVMPPKPGEPQKPVTRPERVVSPKPGEPQKPVTRPERVMSPKPGEPQKPVTRPERVVSPKPGEPQKPVTRPERVMPPKPGEPEKPVTRPERVMPPKPGEPQKPVTRPERVVSPKPGEPEKPVTRPERVMPAKPERPTAPESVRPEKPGQAEKPGQQETPR